MAGHLLRKIWSGAGSVLTTMSYFARMSAQCLLESENKVRKRTWITGTGVCYLGSEIILQNGLALMFDRFSMPARRVILWARAEAGNEGATSIEPKHLLLGFLIEDQGESESKILGGAAKATDKSRDKGQPFFAGADVTRLRSTLAEKEKVALPHSNNTGMELSEQTQSILATALQKADTSNVQTAHLLSAFVNSDVSEMNQLLGSSSIQWDQVDEIIRGSHES